MTLPRDPYEESLLRDRYWAAARNAQRGRLGAVVGGIVQFVGFVAVIVSISLALYRCGEPHRLFLAEHCHLVRVETGHSIVTSNLDVAWVNGHDCYACDDGIERCE